MKISKMLLDVRFGNVSEKIPLLKCTYTLLTAKSALHKNNNKDSDHFYLMNTKGTFKNRNHVHINDTKYEQKALLL